MSDIFSKIGKGIEIIVIGILIMLGLAILLIVSFFMHDYSQYAHGDIDKIKQLEYNQGHSLETILNHYNTYNKKM